MREIKFRVWNGEEMEESKLSFNFDYEQTKKEIHIYQEDIFMQYTGVKTKEGVEIYDGDIIKCVSSSQEYISEIIYGQDNMNGEEYDYSVLGFIPKTDTLDYIDKEFIYNMFLLGAVEVIGNIYENPELLKDNQ